MPEIVINKKQLCLKHNSHISDKKYASISSTPDSDSEEGTCTYS